MNKIRCLAPKNKNNINKKQINADKAKRGTKGKT
jgi:hypothetical protein